MIDILLCISISLTLYKLKWTTKMHFQNEQNVSRKVFNFPYDNTCVLRILLLSIAKILSNSIKVIIIYDNTLWYI